MRDFVQAAAAGRRSEQASGGDHHEVAGRDRYEHADDAEITQEVSNQKSRYRGANTTKGIDDPAGGTPDARRKHFRLISMKAHRQRLAAEADQDPEQYDQRDSGHLRK